MGDSTPHRIAHGRLSLPVYPPHRRAQAASASHRRQPQPQSWPPPTASGQRSVCVRAPPRPPPRARRGQSPRRCRWKRRAREGIAPAGKGEKGERVHAQQTYFRRGGVSRPDVCSKAQPCSRQTAKTYNLTPEKARITPESAGTPRRASTRKPLRAQRSGCTVQRSGATCCAYVCQPRPPLARPPRQYGLIQAYQGPRSLEAQISAASGPSPHSAMFARQCS